MLNEAAGMILAMETINDRIEHRILLLDTTQADLARAAGLTRGAISQWKSGLVANLKPPNLVSAADHLRCRIRWLATGDGPEEKPKRLTPAQRTILDNMRAISEQDQQTLVRMSEHMRRDASTAHSDMHQSLRALP